MNQKFNDPKAFLLWHERLRHPGLSMMRRIVKNSNGHPLTSRQILKSHDFSCTACSQGKLIIRPYFTKIVSKSPAFLEHIQGDICGLIHPPSGPFRYFMVLIDASTRWSHVCLLFTQNVAFARLLAQIIRSWHNSLIIISRQFVLIMLVNSHLKPSLVIVCPLE